MSDDQKDDATGGAAFPCPETSTHYATDGMTLRDYFAAKAMQGCLTNQVLLDRISKRSGGDLERGHEELAAGAYLLADAMLRERAK